MSIFKMSSGSLDYSVREIQSGNVRMTNHCILVTLYKDTLAYRDNSLITYYFLS